MNVRVDLREPIRDGMEVVFKAPCDYANVTGLNLYYPSDGVMVSQTFAFADAHANDLADLDVLFAKDAVVKVILDLDANMAFVQNADTNAYLEGRFKNIGETLMHCASAVECEATGDVIAVNDASNQPLAGLNIYGKTVQNGTPTPESPVPLESVGESGAINVTVAGKNLFDDIGWFESHGFTKQSDGSWLGEPEKETVWENTARKEGSMYVTASVKSSAANTSIPMYIIVYYTDGTKWNAVSAFSKDGWIKYGGATDSTKTVDYINWFYGGDGIYYVKDVTISFVDGEYEPYQPIQTLTASTPNGLAGLPMPSNAVNNGGFIYQSDYVDANGNPWITDHIDWARGVRVQRFKRYTVTEAYRLLKAANGNGVFQIFVPTDRKLGSYCLCSHYNVPIDFDQNNYNNPTYTSVIYKRISSNPRDLFVVHEGITTIEEYNAWLAENPIEFIYELETPIETPLSAEELAAYAALHTNKPNTTVFNDGGAGLKLTYNADTKLYIDQKISAISAAMLNA